MHGFWAKRGPLPQHICSQAWWCLGSSVKNFGTGKRHPAGMTMPGAVQRNANYQNATELFARTANVSQNFGGQNSHSST